MKKNTKAVLARAFQQVTALTLPQNYLLGYRNTFLSERTAHRQLNSNGLILSYLTVVNFHQSDGIRVIIQILCNTLKRVLPNLSSYIPHLKEGVLR